MAVVNPGLLPAASAASATIKCISRADSMVRGPWLVLLRNSASTAVKSGSGALVMGSFNLMLSTTTVLPPVVQPDTVQSG